jgi:hypothetical protein
VQEVSHAEPSANKTKVGFTRLSSTAARRPVKDVEFGM